MALKTRTKQKKAKKVTSAVQEFLGNPLLDREKRNPTAKQTDIAQAFMHQVAHPEDTQSFSRFLAEKGYKISKTWFIDHPGACRALLDEMMHFLDDYPGPTAEQRKRWIRLGLMSATADPETAPRDFIAAMKLLGEDVDVGIFRPPTQQVNVGLSLSSVPSEWKERYSLPEKVEDEHR